jgi:hypothetical protein
MRLAREVSKFTSSCEALISETIASRRNLTEDETELIEYYCREIVDKVPKREPPPLSPCS